MVNIRRAGTDALLLEVDAPHTWFAAIDAARARGEIECRELVPGAQTLLIIGVDPDDPVLGALIDSTAKALTCPFVSSVEETAVLPLEIAVRWDGPDLDEVGTVWGCDPIAVMRETVFTVAFGGFAPGFAYLTGLAEKWHLARRPTPRASVPVGSVAVAGAYAGIYPRSTPGGWHLLGSTDAVLFDVERQPPALLLPGMTVRMIDA
ncbi:KipI family sensor histidine kinase inhibitor [Allocatelliglobosispora scoriae]|uniref:KipI family sensor histidine kinase inhibitor n=1 Tax=Allocatelliglobosispora scoriae TaxID=643052 RepID=A0A841BPV8_9ACTN|nr:carboxyltransferase domain-containing protein [Allocatelliglobosispora scoriae]MBB5871107.1 KipI family sensor histidine kinase inhibitor [Allocatelliglobosispora scoriae]